MKKVLSLILVATVFAGLTACGPKDTATPGPATQAPVSQAPASQAPATQAPADDVSVGVAIYKFDDTFMTGVRNAISAQAGVLGVTADIVDSQNKQPTQNDQVDAFLTKGMNALAINAVDRTAAGPIIQKAKADNVPVVFFNREPEAADMASYDKVWYVGAKAEESGTMSGDLLVDYWKSNPGMDRNGDGKLQYIMLTGEPGHQDAMLRTEYSIKAINDAGIETVLLATDTAMWDKVKATDIMKGYISSIGIENIEAVLGNNDDMALGAIEALKANGYNTGDAAKYIPVVGVDATAPALESMSKGELLGTVLNDAVNQGNATINIAAAAAQGKEINKANIGYEVTDGKYVWVPYVKVTKENMDQFK